MSGSERWIKHRYIRQKGKKGIPLFPCFMWRHTILLANTSALILILIRSKVLVLSLFRQVRSVVQWFIHSSSLYFQWVGRCESTISCCLWQLSVYCNLLQVFFLACFLVFTIYYTFYFIYFIFVIKRILHNNNKKKRKKRYSYYNQHTIRTSTSWCNFMFCDFWRGWLHWLSIFSYAKFFHNRVSFEVSTIYCSHFIKLFLKACSIVDKTNNFNLFNYIDPITGISGGVQLATTPDNTALYANILLFQNNTIKQ